MPRRRAVRMMRQAISPRLAIRTLLNICGYILNMPKRLASADEVVRSADQGSTGALRLAESARARAVRVSAGGMMPSSQRRAEA